MSDTNGAMWLRYPIGALIIAIGCRALWLESTPPIHPWHFAIFLGVVMLGGGIMIPDPVFGALSRGLDALKETGLPFVGKGTPPSDGPKP